MNTDLSLSFKKTDYKKLKTKFLFTALYKNNKINSNLDILFNKQISNAIKIDLFKSQMNKKSPDEGLEPSTTGLKVLRSTN